MPKNKYFLLFGFIIIFLVFYAGSARALEITSYPSIPGLVAPSSSCTGNDCLDIYVAYWFGLLVYVAGALALISFAVGAVMYLASMENPEIKGNAADRMKGAVLGLALTLVSFMIIRTINIKLITPTLTPLPGVQGVYYIGGNNERKPVADSVGDTSSRPTGFNSIIYDCTGTGTGGTGPVLMIWEFPNTGLEDGNSKNLNTVRVVEKTCGQQENISGFKSFKIGFQTPGVYFYKGPGQTGYASGPNTVSQDNISFGSIKSIKIVNNTAKDVYYGAIFHKEYGRENAGVCGLPITPARAEPTIKADINMPTIFAVDIFKLNKNPISSGSGVDFYSRPNSGGGKYAVDGGEITFPYFKKDTAAMCYVYPPASNVPATEKYKCNPSPVCTGKQNNAQWCDPTAANNSCPKGEICDPDSEVCINDPSNGGAQCSNKACETFHDCSSGSVKIKGNYLIALYAIKNNKETDCQTYQNLQQVPNEKVQDITRSGQPALTNIYIIPIQFQ